MTDLNLVLNAISQAHLKIGLHRLNQILIEVSSQDEKFSKWLKENGYDDIVTKNKNVKQSGWSKEEFSCFPWYDRKGKLMIKEETIRRLENLLCK